MSAWDSVVKFLTSEDTAKSVFTGAIGGGIASAFAYFGAKKLEAIKARHNEDLEEAKVRLKLETQMHELITAQRLEKVVEYHARVTELRNELMLVDDVGPISWGVEFAEEIGLDSRNASFERGRRNGTRIREINRLVESSEILLGSRLCQLWTMHHAAINHLALQLRSRFDEKVIIRATNFLREQMEADLRMAIDKTLGLPASDEPKRDVKDATKTGEDLGSLFITMAIADLGADHAKQRMLDS